MQHRLKPAIPPGPGMASTQISASRKGPALARSTMFIVGALTLALLAPAGPASGQTTRPRVLYVTNLDGQSIAMFTVDRQTGALATLGSPLPAGTEPRGVVATPDGRFVYVADLGQVLVYSVARSGALTALDPAPADGDPFGLAMAPDGRTVYASSQGTDRVSPFSVGADGRLTPLPPVPSGGTNPRGVAVSPDSRFVYVSNGLRDPATPGTLAIFAVLGDRSLKLLKSIDIGRFGAGITISPDGGFLYVDSQASNEVHGYRRGADGLLTELAGSPVVSPNDPEGIVITPDAEHVYVAATGQLPDGTADVPGTYRHSRSSPAAASAAPGCSTQKICPMLSLFHRTPDSCTPATATQAISPRTRSARAARSARSRTPPSARGLTGPHQSRWRCSPTRARQLASPLNSTSPAP
jgi:DNA-binding beta-propeller fold protein YncE